VTEPARLHDAGDSIDSILARVRAVADLIGLRDWTFEVEIAALAPGVRAQCECVEGRSFARITVSREFFDLEPEEQNEALVHETIHPLMHPLMEHVHDLREDLGLRQWQTVERVFRRDLERIVDALTATVASELWARLGERR
jgi:hypothetical protein